MDFRGLDFHRSYLPGAIKDLHKESKKEIPEALKEYVTHLKNHRLKPSHQMVTGKTLFRKRV